MEAQIFRQKVRHYCHLAGYSQNLLAPQVGLPITTFSHKLNGLGQFRLTNSEIKLILKTLAGWDAFTSYAQVVELLEMAGLDINCFSSQDWQSPPFTALEGIPPEGLSHQIETVPPGQRTSSALSSRQTRVSTWTPVHSARLEQATQDKAKSQPGQTLPLSMTSLVGRSQETIAIKKMLYRSEVRLLNLTGPGGVGKTRLALHCAAEVLPDFEHGVYFVSLVALHDPALVAPAIAQTLGLKVGKDQSLTALLAYLGDKRVLMVLDNFEQVSGAASLVGQLLAAAPGLKVLLTSRVRLRLYGEHEFNVPPLALPQITNPETLNNSEAVVLFLQRGQAAKSDFVLTPENSSIIAQICTRLDGLPLAIELAAARLKLLPPAALLSRLDKRLHFLTDGPHDVPAHQQTLRNTLDWSYDLLNPAEQALFQNLALFADGATLEAVEVVLGSNDVQAGAGSFELLNGLTSLMDKSLLFQSSPDNQFSLSTQPRFKLLETMREYALEHLNQQGETHIAALRHQHANYYRQLAEEAAMQLLSSVQQDWLDRLEADHNNFRLALEWTCANDRLNGLKLATALSQFWYLRGYWQEGLGWLNRLLDAAPPGKNPVRAGALQATGLFTYNLGEALKALPIYRESFEQWQFLDDKANVARTLTWLGVITNNLGDYSQAQNYYGQALAIRHLLDDKRGAAAALSNLGNIATTMGNYELAWKYSLEGLALVRQTNDQILTCAILNNLGWVASNQENWPLARSYVEESLVLARKLTIKRIICRALENLGLVAAGQSDWGAAIIYLEESLQLAQAACEQHGIAAANLYLGLIAYRQADYVQATSLVWSSLQMSLPGSNQALIAEGLSVLSSILASQPTYENLAVRLAGTLHELQTISGIVTERVLQISFVEALTALRNRLPAPRFEIEFALGRATSLNDLANYLKVSPVSAAYLAGIWLDKPDNGVVTTNSDKPAAELTSPLSKTQRFAPWQSLTERERDVLELLATTSLNNQEMARQMSVAVSTVRTHIRNVYSKLDIQNRFQAIQFARELGLL